MPIKVSHKTQCVEGHLDENAIGKYTNYKNSLEESGERRVGGTKIGR